MDYKFLINEIDVTKDILDFSYDDNLNDVATSFSFSSLQNFDLSDYGDTNSLNCIKIIDNQNSNTAYVGFITDFEHTTDKNIFSYSGFDCGYYLNNNDVLIQFRDENIGNAIVAMCREYQVNCNIPQFNNRVKKIYKDVPFGDVVKELLILEKDKGGANNLYIDCKRGKLEILPYTLAGDLSACVAKNFYVDSLRTVSNISVSKTIQGLKNRIIITDNNDENMSKTTAINNDSVQKYGLLTDIVKVDVSKTNNLSALANQKLKETSVIKQEYTLSLLGDYNVCCGKILDLNIPEYDIIGQFLITSAKHQLSRFGELVNIKIAEL